MRQQRVSGPPLGWLASLVGRPTHYGAQLAHGSVWCLLERSRVVFRGFHELNHLLPSVCLFGVYDSGPGVVCWINPPAYKYSPKLMEFISLKPYSYVW
jgi:hypothetical protein